MRFSELCALRVGLRVNYFVYAWGQTMLYCTENMFKDKTREIYTKAPSTILDNEVDEMPPINTSKPEKI